MENIWLVLICFLAYLCGSFPTGYLIAKKRGIDIKKIGSGAIGTTNVGRALGWKFAAITFIVDTFKTWLPVFLAILILSGNWMICLAAILAVIGHIFPVWLKFKGGKGVASLIGILLALNFKLTLFWVLIWIITFLILTVAIKISKSSFSERMAANNLLTVWFLPVLFWFIFSSSDWVVFSLILVAIVYVAHRENILRMKKRWKRNASS